MSWFPRLYYVARLVWGRIRQLLIGFFFREVPIDGAAVKDGAIARTAANTGATDNASGIPRARPASRDIRRHMLWALCLSSILVIGLGGWAATSQLSGAVVATGQVVVEDYSKKVQHRQGGIVGEILVRNGDHVAAGQPLMRLDDTLVRTNLAIITKQLRELRARALRLRSERDGLDRLADHPMAHSQDPDDQALIRAQNALFLARKTNLDGQRSLLRERVTQIQNEATGLRARRDAKFEEHELIVQELIRVNKLYNKRLIGLPRLVALRREQVAAAGEKGQLEADLARAATRIAETELEIVQLDKAQLTDILVELREVEGKIAELEEQEAAAADELRRIDIIAPASGIVHELMVHTVGGTVGGGEVIMQIVPSRDRLRVEARVPPADIDQIHVGQQAMLRFVAFNARTTPEVFGEVITVAADLTHDPSGQSSWYRVRIAVARDELDNLGKLLPGMPVETFIQTESRTALSYFLRPFQDQLARAMREE